MRSARVKRERFYQMADNNYGALPRRPWALGGQQGGAPIHLAQSNDKKFDIRRDQTELLPLRC